MTANPTNNPTSARPTTIAPTNISGPWSQIGVDINGPNSNTYIGQSTSLSSDGSVVAVGAPNIYRVWVYKIINNVWTKLGSDIIGGEGSNFGFSVSLSCNGGVLAVGSPNSGPGWYNGKAEVFKFANNSWTKIWGIVGSDWDKVGYSVSLSADGNVMAFGANGAHTAGGYYSGYVGVYQYINSVRTQLGGNINGESTNIAFGARVSLSGDGSVVAVGAELDGGISNVFKYANNTWGKINNGIEALRGPSVALSYDGSIFASGTNYVGKLGRVGGTVQVYKFANNTWSQVGETIISEIGPLAASTSTDNFGWSVDLSNDGSILAVGATLNDGNGVNSGHARVFQYINNNWTQLGSDIDGEAAGDQFGWSVSLSSDGSILAVGSPFNAGGGSNSGHVRVFQNLGASAMSPTNIGSLVACTSIFSPTQIPTRNPTAVPSSPPSIPPPTANPSIVPTSTPTTTVTPSSVPTGAVSQSPTTAYPTSTQQANAPTTASSSTSQSEKLPFVGRCPAQINKTTAVTHHYEPGERVSKGLIVFECKTWPNSLFCSQIAFTPDIDSKSDSWKQAWEVVGHCMDTSSPPEDGCPDAWTSGDTYTKYKENDRVSVIRSNTPLIQVVYKCKAWPYSWYCGQHSPLDYNGDKLGWEYVGECAGTIGPTSNPTLPPGTVVISGCPAKYNSANDVGYIAGDQVSWIAGISSYTQIVYQCREYPFSGYCNQKEGFAPGEQYDYVAWTIIGPCQGTLVPTSSPTAYSGTCTYLKVVTATPTPTPVITPVTPWSAAAVYNAGDQVRIGATKFQCKPWPFYFWCRLKRTHPLFLRLGCGLRLGP